MSVDAAIDGIPIKDGLYGKIPDFVYHQDRGSLSSSGARLLLPPSCPAKFKERMDNPPKPKREYDFGHVAHRLILGEGADIVEIEAPDYRTKDAREQRDKAHADDKVPVLTSELDKARRMADKVLRDPDAGPLFKRGHAEVSLYHVDPETGVRLRARPDWLTLIDDRLWCVDFKTTNTANLDEFERKAAGFGYHLQAAFYLDLLIALEIHAEPAFVLVACEKDAPHIVSVREPDAEAVAEGRRRNRQAIRLYARCHERDEWPSYATGIVPMSLPPWAFTETTLDDLFTAVPDGE